MDTWTNSNYRNVTVNTDHWCFSSFKSIHLLPLLPQWSQWRGWSLNQLPSGECGVCSAHQRASMNHFRAAKSPQIQRMGRLREEAAQTRVEYANFQFSHHPSCKMVRLKTPLVTVGFIIHKVVLHHLIFRFKQGVTGSTWCCTSSIIH